MKDRIKQFMLDRNMTQKALAAELCISESTLTGIFTGRTRPTVNIIDAFHQFFPEVNMYWLMYGEGEMYSSSNCQYRDNDASKNGTDSNSSETDINNPIVSSLGVPTSPSDVHEQTSQGDLFSIPPVQHVSQCSYPHQMIQPQIIEKIIDKPQRKITEIRIFFDDGTYETFTA